MISRKTTISLIIMSASILSYADENGIKQDIPSAETSRLNSHTGEIREEFELASQMESIADNKLNYTPLKKINQTGLSHEIDMQSCKADNTALITVFSTNGMAQNEIEVKLDGQPIGTLKTYYPDDTPDCKTPSAKGVITIKVPAGKHILDAESPNLTWPSHTFTVPTCECLLLPLS